MRRTIVLTVLAMLAAPGAALAAGHGEANSSLFGGSIWTAVWSLLIFVLLLVVLGKFAWGPIVKVLQEREERIATALADSETKRADAMKLLDQYRAQLEQSQAESARLLQQTQAEAEKVRKSIVDQARTEADDARKRAVEQIQATKNEAVAALFTHAADVATQVAGQILHREVCAEDHARLIEQTLSEMASARASN